MKKYIDLDFFAKIVIFILFVFFVGCIFISIGNFSNASSEKRTGDIEALIRKAAIQCYALEGAYPPDIHYIANKYGVGIDEGSYVYYYETYGSNIMPSIVVFKK